MERARGMKEVAGEAPVRVQTAPEFGSATVRIIIVTGAGHTGGVNHLPQGTQMVARVVVAARRRAGDQLDALAEIPLLHGCARCIPLLTNPHPAPDKAAVVHHRAILLLDDPHPTPKAVIREFRT